MSWKDEEIRREEIDACFAAERLGTDERIDPADGLPHCIRCGERTAIVKRNPLRNHEVIIAWCMCKCRREEEQRIREEEAGKEKMRLIERRRLAGLQDACLRDYRFENGRNETSEMKKAMHYAEHFTDCAEEYPGGLVFFGPVGTGKTFAAGCIANALIDRNIPVLMTSFPKLLSMVAEERGSSWTEEIRRMQDYSLLILDDFGVERETPFALEKMFYVIDERYKSGKPFILTTNLTVDEMRNPKDLAHQRIYDRIRERCGFVLFNTKNYREEGAEKCHQELRQFFEDSERCIRSDTCFTGAEKKVHLDVEERKGVLYEADKRENG